MKITTEKQRIAEILKDVKGQLIYENIENDNINFCRNNIETKITFEPKDIPQLANIIVKMCGKLNNEGQQHIRLHKDKDNQKVVDILLKQYKTAKASLKSNSLHLKEGALRDLTSKEFMDIEVKCSNLKEMISRIE